MPPVRPDEVKDTLTEYVQHNIEVQSLTVEVVRCVCRAIEPVTVVSRPHIGTHTDTLVWPHRPLEIGVQSHRYAGWPIGGIMVARPHQRPLSLGRRRTWNFA